MKNKIFIALIAALSVTTCQLAVAQTSNNTAVFSQLPPAVQAQLLESVATNPPAAIPAPPPSIVNAITNLPTVPLANETVGVGIGTVIEGTGAAIKNIETVDFSVSPNFFVGAQLINAAGTGSVLESGGLRLGFQKPFSTAKFYGYIGGERDWSKNIWDGYGGIGLAYTPFGSQSNLLQNFSAAIEEQIVVNPSDLKSQPPQRSIVCVRYSF